MPIRYVARRAHLGRLNVSTADAQGSLQGTHTPPPARTGVIGTQLQPAVLAALGGFTPSANRTGSIITTLDGGAGQLLGTFAAPGGATLSHGGAFSLTGANLGTKPAGARTFLGGSGGPIESTAVGANISNNIPGWNTTGAVQGSSRGDKKGFNDTARGRVLTSSYSSTVPPDCACMSWDSGSTIKTAGDAGYGGTPEITFTSLWFQLVNVVNYSTGQVKLQRWTAIDDITDPNTQLYLSIANHNGGALSMLASPNGGGTTVGTSNPFVQSTWYRVDTETTFPSGQNVADGKCLVRIFTGTSILTPGFSFSSGATNNTLNIYATNARSRWFILPQAYMGNSITNGIFRTDDPYIQRGSIMRVELCNNVNFAAATHREIQLDTSWTPNQIDGIGNHGSFTPGSTAWLHGIGPAGTSLVNKQVLLV